MSQTFTKADRASRAMAIKKLVLPVLLHTLGGCKPSSGTEARAASDAFMAVYRWRVRPGCEARFQAAWRAAILASRSTWGSYGRWLTRTDDGAWVALAFWPSRARWAEAHREPLQLAGPEATRRVHCREGGGTPASGDGGPDAPSTPLTQELPTPTLRARTLHGETMVTDNS